MIHVDWMIGCDELDIDGITSDGTIIASIQKWRMGK